MSRRTARIRAQVADIRPGDDPRQDAAKIAQARAGDRDRARAQLTALSIAMAAVIEETARAGARVPRPVRDKVNDLALCLADIHESIQEKTQ